MKLIVLTAAAKALDKMPKQDAKALVAKLKTFAADPFAAHGWAKRMVGEKATRIRHGDWRAMCVIDQGMLIVTVVKVGKRGEIYR